MTSELPRTAPPPGARPPHAPMWLGANQAVWQARAVAYTLTFVLLVCALVGMRFATRTVQPTLEALQAQKTRLLERQRTLSSEAQQLTSPARIRQFALSRGMIPFSKAVKQSLKVQAIPRESPLPAVPALELNTQWRE